MNNFKITIQIKGKLGTEFQKKFANESLRGIMIIYKRELEKKHKDNQLEITIKENATTKRKKEHR